MALACLTAWHMHPSRSFGRGGVDPSCPILLILGCHCPKVVATPFKPLHFIFRFLVKSLLRRVCKRRLQILVLLLSLIIQFHLLLSMDMLRLWLDSRSRLLISFFVDHELLLVMLCWHMEIVWPFTKCLLDNPRLLRGLLSHHRITSWLQLKRVVEAPFIN